MFDIIYIRNITYTPNVKRRENMNEIWKDIKDYEGLYQISSLGRVHSLDRFVPRKTGTTQRVHGRILKLTEDKDGYLQVGLYKNNKMKKMKVHRLVAKAFIPNPDRLPEINHINEIKDDNRVNNLEWCTRKENINHGTRSERVAKIKRKPVVSICLKTGKKTAFKSLREASEFGFHPSAIRKVCIGEQETHKGYSWEFVKEGEEV